MRIISFYVYVCVFLPLSSRTLCLHNGSVSESTEWVNENSFVSMRVNCTFYFIIIIIIIMLHLLFLLLFLFVLLICFDFAHIFIGGKSVKEKYIIEKDCPPPPISISVSEKARKKQFSLKFTAIHSKMKYRSIIYFLCLFSFSLATIAVKCGLSRVTYTHTHKHTRARF